MEEDEKRLFVFSFFAILTIFLVGFTLHVCACRRPVPFWRPRSKQVAQFALVDWIVLFNYVGDVSCDDVTCRYAGPPTEHGDDFECSRHICFGPSNLVDVLVPVAGGPEGQVALGVDSFQRWNGAPTCTPCFQDLHQDEQVEERSGCCARGTWCRTRGSRQAIPIQNASSRRRLSASSQNVTLGSFGSGSWDATTFFDYSCLPQGDDRTKEEKGAVRGSFAGHESALQLQALPGPAHPRRSSGQASREAGLVLHRSGHQQCPEHDHQYVLA